MRPASSHSPPLAAAQAAGLHGPAPAARGGGAKSERAAPPRKFPTAPSRKFPAYYSPPEVFFFFIMCNGVSSLVRSS